MTTTNIDGIEAVFDAARVVHDGAQRRHRELLRDEQRAAQEHTRNLAALATAARVAEARRAEEAARANEERDQLAAILNVIDTPVDDTPVNDTQLPPPDETEVVVTAVTTDDDSELEPAATTTTTTTTRVNHADPRKWGWIAWVTAVIGALIALAIARHTWQWAVEFITTETYRGSWRGFLKFVWYVLVIGFGFLGGGFIGSLIIKPFVNGFRNGDHRARVTRVTTRHHQDPPQAD